jgi:hypothetical protein
MMGFQWSVLPVPHDDGSLHARWGMTPRELTSSPRRVDKIREGQFRGTAALVVVTVGS